MFIGSYPLSCLKPLTSCPLLLRWRPNPPKGLRDSSWADSQSTLLPLDPLHSSHFGLLPRSYTKQALCRHRAFAHVIPPQSEHSPSPLHLGNSPFCFHLTRHFLSKPSQTGLGLPVSLPEPYNPFLSFSALLTVAPLTAKFLDQCLSLSLDYELLKGTGCFC